MWAINVNYSFVPRVDLPTADQKNMQPFDDNALIFENGESYAGNSVYDRAAFWWTFLQCRKVSLSSIFDPPGVAFYNQYRNRDFSIVSGESG